MAPELVKGIRDRKASLVEFIHKIDPVTRNMDRASLVEVFGSVEHLDQ